MRRGWIALVSALTVTHAAIAADAPKIDSFHLENGMEVIVIENHRVPAVSHMLWFRVGAADDPLQKSGLAHYHEHMMFQGTEHYKKGEYSDIIARNGGDQNAFTGHDATAYYANIAKDRLPVVMELEADRLRALAPNDADAEKERAVIIEERRQRVENDPDALMYEQMRAAQFLHHPYRIPVIGWMHEMEGLTKDDVLEFHRRYYHPGNALLLVSGDITAEELKPLAEKYYGDIPTAVTPPREWRSEPPQRAARRLSMTHPNVSQPGWTRLYTTFSVSEGKTELAPALFVLEQILGGGNSSRLYRALVVERKLAAAISADYSGFTRGPGTFSIGGVPAEGIAPETLEKAVDEELARLLKEDITAEELARAKALMKANTLYAREGLQSMAYNIGWLRMIGKPANFFLEWPDTLEAVTAEQVRQAATETLRLEHSVTGMLLPEKPATPAAPAEKTAPKKPKGKHHAH